VKYKCIVLDHDDTVVRSTECVHYPAFTKGMESLRPSVKMTLPEYFEMNSSIGILKYYDKVAHLTEEEKEWEHAFWVSYIGKNPPRAYSGIKELIEEEKRQGGIVAVVTHNTKENILRDYEANSLPLPDVIYSGELPEEKRKPSPWPIFDIMQTHGLRREDIVVIDDLVPGHQMALSANVDFIFPSYAHSIESIHRYMRDASVPFASSVEELCSMLFP